MRFKFDNITPLFEDVISNNTEETKKIESFSSTYDELEFALTEVENRMRTMDTLIGTYKAKNQSLEVSINFYENDSGSWTIKAYGFNSEQSSTLDASFDYEDFEAMLNVLKTTFLNLEINDDLDVWICGNEYCLSKTDTE